ncbi:MAG TPA: MATE family efflux transporter [Candidatus Enterocloster excrementipullorum]|uniref:Probable multidrug resistance protein NorM n=1 Tax=Candidatus Enterocloster excrementipullorum TaxID=2838559 RepID=A0A9D2SIN3_9FIRM|nr:MATE family efflux transporter [Candidatus Enterocloster excrementipullorum]
MFTRTQLIKLLAPLIVEQILTVLVGMADVVMVAAVGEAAVSGVSLVDSISILIIQIMGAMATGGAVVYSQYLGKRQVRDAGTAAGQLVFVTLAISLGVTAVALAGNRRLLSAIFGQVEREVMDNAQTYFLITAMSYPFIGLYNACAALFRSMGNAKVSMFTSLVMNGINITGNAVCVFGLKMGVAGVAYPTLVSRMTAAVLIFVLLQNRHNEIRISGLKALKPHSGMIRTILSVGIPGGLENGMFQFGKIFLQSLVSSLGTASIASYAVACNLVTLLYLPGNALGLGLITIVGQCVGAGKPREAMHYTEVLLAVNYLILAVLSTAMFFGTDLLVSFYNLSPEAAAISHVLLQAHCVAMILWPAAFTLPNALRAALDARFTMAVSVFSMWAFRIGFAYLFVYLFDLGVPGVWYGMFIDWVFRALVFAGRFAGFEKRAMSV